MVTGNVGVVVSVDVRERVAPSRGEDDKVKRVVRWAGNWHGIIRRRGAVGGKCSLGFVEPGVKWDAINALEVINEEVAVDADHRVGAITGWLVRVMGL